jgi:hypothetical protein
MSDMPLAKRQRLLQGRSRTLPQQRGSNGREDPEVVDMLEDSESEDDLSSGYVSSGDETPAVPMARKAAGATLTKLQLDALAGQRHGISDPAASRLLRQSFKQPAKRTLPGALLIPMHTVLVDCDNSLHSTNPRLLNN